MPGSGAAGGVDADGNRECRLLNGLLVRVGADQSRGGGGWNGPVDLATGQFVYVPIPEVRTNWPGLDTPCLLFTPALRRFGVEPPPHLSSGRVHLDPDFQFLTYGDRGQKGRRIAVNLQRDDLMVFYSSLRDIGSGALVYAIIGLFVISDIVLARNLPVSERHRNAHTRRVLPDDADDIIVIGRAGQSGRLERCLPIGQFRAKAYRVLEPLLAEWGGLSAHDGFLQRSAVFPRFLDAERFWKWWQRQEPVLVQANIP